jgi:hypothetical protein
MDIPIDPLLIPLPDDDDRDICDPHTILKTVRLSAAKKAAGSRRSVPAVKQQATLEKSTKRKGFLNDGEPDGDSKPPKRGRPMGAGNYTDDDIATLLDFVEEELLLGQCGWRVVHAKLTRWAHRHQRPEHTLKSIKTKFKQV